MMADRAKTLAVCYKAVLEATLAPQLSACIMMQSWLNAGTCSSVQGQA
jgi:hypothetical protein